MRIGRNDRCPCGSGLKYKKCCINKPKNKVIANTAPKKKTEEIPFLSKFDRVDILKTIAALSILPENHGKNIRLEELSVRILLEDKTGSAIPDERELQTFLDTNYPSHYMEDLSINTFTDLITFYGGDYITFPGITENGQEIVNNLLSAVFQWPGSGIPDWFRSNTFIASKFMLGISHKIATRLGYVRYQVNQSDRASLFVPENDRLEQVKQALTITNQEMDIFLKENEIPADVIHEFVLTPDEEIGEYSLDPDNNALLYKPVLKIPEGYLILSPSTICLALSNFIWTMAQTGNCMEKVNDAYHALTWNNVQLELYKLGFTHIEVPEVAIPENIREGFYQFDSDKIAYVRYLADTGKNYGTNGSRFGGPASLEGDGDPQKAIAAVKSLPTYANYEFLSITVLSGIGGEMMYSIKADGADRVLAMPVQELGILASLRETDAIDLWKFTIARDTLSKNAPFLFSVSFLDLFKFYKDNSDSFYLSDDGRDTIPVIEPGYAYDWYVNAKLKADKHSELRKEGHRLAFIPVEKKDSSWPVYYHLHDVATGKLKLALGGYNQPIWVSPHSIAKDANITLKSMYLQITEGIAYWLWQIETGLRDELAKLGDRPLEIKFEFDNEERFSEVERNYVRIENLDSYFEIEANKEGYKITIPSEILPYLYGADNEGERVLVRQMISGFNEVLTLNGLPQIPDEYVEGIIEADAPLGMKKKFYILDTSDNLLIDPTNLKKHRYVKDYDTCRVSDQVTVLLGDACPPIGEIKKKEERNKLAQDIANKALLNHLRDKLAKLDSFSLLKRLIGLNESLIKEREMLKIHIPTRIACFVSVEEQIAEVHQSLAKINRTTIAVRCLIEHIAAEQDNGKKEPSTTDIDELVGIMDQIISWGSLSDQIHYDLFDIKMSVLPSGRIGTEKQMASNIFDPYQQSKTTENVDNAIAAFAQVFPQNNDEEGSEVPEKLDKAFINDYGVSFTRICNFSDALSYIGFSQSTDYASLPLDVLRDEVNKTTDPKFSKEEFDNVISYLSLENRGKIEKIDKKAGFEFIDIMPWRFNRMLSLARRPVVIFGGKGDAKKIVLWGPRQLLDSKGYLADQCLSDRLRVPEGRTAIKSVLGEFANLRGDKLVKSIIKSIDPTGLIVDEEIFIGPNRELKHTSDIGDIDVLVIDPVKKIINSLESKSMSPSRNIKEMVEEVNKLFGSSSDKGWIGKHIERHKWIEANKDQLSKKYGIDLSDFEVKSFFVTEEDMLTPYLRKMTLPLPFITRYELEKNGYSAISQNTNPEK